MTRDLFPDGWEVRYNFDPNTVNSPAPGADGDGDGLNNFDEMRHGTNPQVKDTDGDGINDGAEVLQGSDPADASDGGKAGNCVRIELAVGDESGSHSERWALDVGDHVSHVAPVFGQLDTKTYSFVKGKSYVFRVRWIASMLSPPDYDYTARIGGFRMGEPASGWGYGNGYVIDDTQALLGTTPESGGGVNTAAGKSGTLYVPKVDLIPDYNRDGTIDEADLQKVAEHPFFFWMNDASDSGFDGGTDIPGASSPNCGDSHVNGVRDLINFFPVWLRVNNTLTLLPPSDYDYILKHGAVNVLLDTGLHAYSSDPDQKPNAFLYSTNWANAHAGATVQQVSLPGITLPPAWLSAIQVDPTLGLMLLEGRGVSCLPLVLEIKRKTDGVVFVHCEMSLGLDGVEKMFMHKNLRSVAGGSQSVADRSAAPNYPAYWLNNSKNLIFVHGNNTDEQAARGWESAMFKRFYWAGSNAKFYGITWRADQGGDANYHQHVNAAFLTASNLADYVKYWVDGEKILMAFSLGNILVSSAIQDYGMSIDKYIMVDAAVATECYDPATFNDSTNNNYMLHTDWRLYQPRTWASEWNQLFTTFTNDDRAKLTWRDRFSTVRGLGSKVSNFYSSEDEAFEIYTNGAIWGTTGVDFDNFWDSVGSVLDGRYGWQKQELFKGRWSITSRLGTTDYAGWGFHTTWLGSREYSANQANAASDDQLRTDPVFRDNPSCMFNSTISTALQNDILATGIPALSYSTGRYPPVLTGLFNFDMANNVHRPNGWPRDDEIYHARWLHSDIHNMAYLYTYFAFKNIVQQGGLQ